MRRITRVVPVALAIVLAVLAPAAIRMSASQPAAKTATTAGELIIDPPTLINLGFEWLIEGDANRDASVDVAFRRVGDAEWRVGLPLLRLQNERIKQGQQLDVVAPNMFAGSIFDLAEGTAYQVRLTLKDPDGVRGDAQRIVTVKTRREPMPAAGGAVYHVYPPGFKGAKSEPSFEGLMCAYNLTCAGTDWATAGRPRVKPGDTILVHAGVYKYNRLEYTNDPAVNRTVPLDGTYYLTGDGTEDRPIVIKGAGDGEAIFDGDGNFSLFDLKAADYHYFEDLTFRNSDYGMFAGLQFVAGAKGLTVKHCRFEDVGAGIFTNYSGSSNYYIADSTFIGRNDPGRVIGWNGAFWSAFNGVDGQKFPPVMASYVAVKVYGPGHVIAFNYVADFHDGIDIETYGNPDGSSANDGPFYPPAAFRHLRPVAIDFYNNVMTNFHDNPFETDGGMHNVRVMRNVMINSASHELCNQPSLGGPVYWIRNIAYHLPGGSTRLTGGSSGVVMYNNTILSETAAQSASNVHWRNNLMLGEQSAPSIFVVNTLTNYSSSDYNGFRPNDGAPFSFAWNSPPPGVGADFTSLAAGAAGTTGKLQARQFRTLEEYSAATGQDRHSIVVDYGIFVNVPALNAQDRDRVQRVYRFQDLDFRLKRDAAAVDRGTLLPNVTDRFTGTAPDLGALEVDQPVPAYGPRR